jgi:ApeA-like protein/HEPN superfamily Apea-like protein
MAPRKQGITTNPQAGPLKLRGKGDRKLTADETNETEGSESHPCEWYYGDQSFPGTAELAPMRPPGGQLFGWLLPRAESMSFPQDLSTDVLWGRLRSNEDIALVDAGLEIWFPDRAIVSARAAIVGLNLRSEKSLLFAAAEVQVTNLPALIGTVPLKSYKFPRSETTNPLEGSYEVEGNPEASLKWTSEDGTLSCRYDIHMGGWDGFRLHVDTVPLVEIRPPKGLTLLDYVDVWVTPLLQIATFLSGRKQQITQLALLRDRSEHSDSGRPTSRQRLKVYGSSLGQSVYAAARPDPSQPRPMYAFSELPYDLLELLERWRRLTADVPQALKPYLNTLFMEDLPARAKFLYLAQTIEAIHRSLENPGVYTTHKSMRDAVLKRVKELELEQPMRAFLHDRIDRHGGPSLKSRIENLVDTVPGNIQNVALVADLASQVPRVRDDLSHGLKDYEPQELRPFIRAMKLLADAHLLGILELSPDHAVRLLDDEWK